MATIREMFHEIGNWHNKISMGAGVTKAVINQDKKNKRFPNAKEIIKRLTELERLALGADKALNKLKSVVYRKVDPDTGKLRR